MGRSTFEGPILAADQRFGPQRDAGTVVLTQYAFLNFATSTAGTAGYGGSNQQFVSSNNIPNSAGTIWTPQAGSYSNTGPTTATITADGSNTSYRGVVFLLPQGSFLQEVLIDNIVAPTDGTNTATTLQPYISNNFATSAGVYATSASITVSSIGRTAATFSATQYANAQSTLQDVQNIQPGQQPTWFSQVVVTLAYSASTLNTLTTGKAAVTIRYAQADLNIGNSTTYPYGNFD
jgi:hypothetical protein